MVKDVEREVHCTHVIKNHMGNNRLSPKVHGKILKYFK